MANIAHSEAGKKSGGASRAVFVGASRAAAIAGALFLLPLAVPTTALAQSGQVQGYVLGPNDNITVVVYGQNEFNVQTRVKPDGSIVMPLIGKVQAQGKTVITLADEITRRLVAGNYLKDPIVNVEVTEYNSKYVRVAGKVGVPGLVPLDRSNKLLDVLLRSGWVQPAGSQFITIRRAADGKEVRINTEELARGNTADIALDPGDTLFVADAELVYLTGAVARPGGYPLKPGMTVADVIAQAGGVGPTGSSGRVGLKRGGAKETDADQQTKLEAGDVIHIRERLF
ncbi:polysaccharide export protein [Sandaracinobacter sp. RS1-74]|uniref:polysaccharide biosynthesis/export family protein n=1 Tax=Sandaracinobacteroides sayramensis TaxID=2913411 RepID=UPI001EDC5932|nr:polysaccharide biosynthesis/export family protein [Sandaracinobacteroides sayramensis]MCG2840235.1 polysaccharide export protein [Sandaracinobacteroides sayramensis]